MNNLQTFLKIKDQLPLEFKNNFQLFTKFMEYYYKYIDETLYNRDISNLRSLSSTSSDLYQYILEEFSILPNMDFSKYDFFTPMRDFYLKKGTSDGFKFLFEQLFGEDISVSYPADRIFSLSEGEWIQNASFFVKLTEDNYFSIDKIEELNGQQLNFISGNNTYSLYVENIKRVYSFNYQTKEKVYSDSYLEIFYNNTNKLPVSSGDILVGTINNISFKAAAVNVTSQFKILNGGYNYKAGDILNCDYNGDNSLLFKVISVDIEGSITQLEILNPSPYISEDVIIDLEHVKSSSNDITGQNQDKLIISYSKANRAWTINLSEPFNKQTSFIESGILSRNPSNNLTPFGFKEQNLLNMDYGVMYDDKNPNIYNFKDLSNILRLFPVNELEALTEQSKYDLNNPSSIKSFLYNNDFDAELGKYNFFKDDRNYNARLQLFSTSLVKKKGYYNNNKSSLSNTMFLSGGKYYHQNSYLVSSCRSISEWRDIVKKTIHPAGSAMFSEHLFNTSLSLSSKPLSYFDTASITVSVKDIINTQNEYTKRDINKYNLEKIYTSEKRRKIFVRGDIIDKVQFIELPKYIFEHKFSDKILETGTLTTSTNKKLKDAILQINKKPSIATDYNRAIYDPYILVKDASTKKEMNKLIDDEIEHFENSVLIFNNSEIQIKETLFRSIEEESIRDGMYFVSNIKDESLINEGGWIEPLNKTTTENVTNKDNITWKDWVVLFGDTFTQSKVSEELDQKEFILNVKEGTDPYGFGIGSVKED